MPDGHFSTGDAQQMRVIAEAFAESIVAKFPAIQAKEKAEVPAMVKAISAILTALIIAGLLWLVSTVNTMQQTLIRIDERQQAQTSGLDSRFGEHERRISQLEGYHRKDEP